jgi:N-acetylglucosaminyldiphosphoundecaprenol N-acetyl-beta-D-mannosaminyltransferase
MSEISRAVFGITFTDLRSLDDAFKVINEIDLSEIDQFKYIVTPNVDHVIRIAKNSALREIYNRAWLCMNDSRVLQLLLGIGGLHLPTIRGSDLTAQLLSSEWVHGKRLIVIGGDERVAAWLTHIVGTNGVFHYNPPMGFIRSIEALDAVIGFIEQRLPAVVFLAVGSPNQEILADACVRKGLRGAVALCVGAGILMAAGIERRAPPALQWAGLEWLYRLVRDPGRLAKRYLLDMRIFVIVARELIDRRSLVK